MLTRCASSVPQEEWRMQIPFKSVTCCHELHTAVCHIASNALSNNTDPSTSPPPSSRARHDPLQPTNAGSRFHSPPTSPNRVITSHHPRLLCWDVGVLLVASETLCELSDELGVKQREAGFLPFAFPVEQNNNNWSLWPDMNWAVPRQINIQKGNRKHG
ncbi:unnamed protein product [Pleuronectes platessa]|uniref:Uncharacterized protein n=1 Tax=Pleuronectes platessa TaxID=8262 RepID=A0A9N7VFY3_PLEPL|nr:unnamed protein product [Pleuronectes platessa]